MIDAALSPGPDFVAFESLPMAAPDDVRALAARMRDGLSAHELVAVFVKTEGNGLDNDWSRPLAVRALRDALCSAGGDADAASPMVVVSGGCEGFTTPHMLLLRRVRSGPIAARAASAALAVDAIGRAQQLELTARLIQETLQSAGLAADEVAYAHVLAPWVEAGLGAGSRAPVAPDAHGSKPFTRAASALGAAVALDALDPQAALDALESGDMSVHGSRCAVTAGATGGRVQVLLLANAAPTARAATGDGSQPQRIRCVTLRDPLDAAALAIVASAGAARAPGGATEALHAPPVAVLFKGDPPAGELRSERLVLQSDSDIHAFRHFRAAMSGVLACRLGTTRLFIGGGAEHQCPPGGGLLAVVHSGGTE